MQIKDLISILNDMPQEAEVLACWPFMDASARTEVDGQETLVFGEGMWLVLPKSEGLHWPELSAPEVPV